MENSWAKGPICPNLVVPRPWSEPGAHSALTSFALNSVASTWLGANSREAVCVWEKGTLMAPEQPPTPGAQSYWLAPYLTLWGAPIIPQELVPHLITVGNTWPFLQWGERKRTRERGRRGESEKDQGKEEESGGGGREKQVLVVFFKSHIPEAREPPNGLIHETTVYIWQALHGVLYLWASERICLFVFI